MDLFRSARQNLMRRQAEIDDIERQQDQQPLQNLQTNNQPQAPTQNPVRSSPVSSVLRRFADLPHPSLPFGRQSAPQPASGSQTVPAKTAQFGVDMPLPSTAPSSRTRSRRHSRPRSWTQSPGGIAEPPPALPAYHVSDSRRRRFDGADPAEMHLATMADDGRRRRQRRQNSQDSNDSGSIDMNDSNGRSSHGGGRHRRRYILGDNGQHAQQNPDKPKKFLFCFPYIKSRRLRAQIMRSSISGVVLALMVGIYLALLLTHSVINSELGILLILILLLTGAFFAHSLVRMVLFIVHPPTAAEEEAAEEMYQRRRRAADGGAGSGALGSMPSQCGPGGFAIPHEPIRVVLARDEEAAGIESVAAKTQPPAYGLWRESVRVDPNRIYWQRNDAVPAVPSQTSRAGSLDRVDESPSPSPTAQSTPAMPASEASTELPSERTRSPRPPSYMSDDGVQYVVEAQPRSIAPTTEVPLPQAAEAGRRW